MKLLTIIVPDNAELLQIAQQASEQRLQLLTDGRHSVLSSIPLLGYWRLIVKVKPQHEQRLAA